MRRRAVLLLLALGIAAVCGAGTSRAAPAGAAAAGERAPRGLVRPPRPGGSMDTNPANLASAVLTHAFGQLPVYIDRASFRLLPFDLFTAFEPGRTRTRTVRVTTPRTQLVLDTAVASALTSEEARRSARRYAVTVSVDGERLPQLGRYWVYYRNDGPQICRIYFPGDLGSLAMAVHSLVLRPLPAGRHSVRVAVVLRLPAAPPARVVTVYALDVLPRPPDAAERASAPADDAPKPAGGTPLVLRGRGR